MSESGLQQLCQLGQEQLMQMDYLAAETALVQAERLALASHDYDTLSRLYMPLQESRRQRRLRCGEGVVCMDLIAAGPDDKIEGRHVVENYPHGQLLVAGWGSIEPAVQVRQLQAEHGLYLETFLAAAYPAADGKVIAIIPLPDVNLPAPEPRSVEALARLLPDGSLVLREADLLHGTVKGTPQTYAKILGLWERLHAPFLADADRQSDPNRKLAGYRKTIQVDYACELAHQHLSDAARALSRKR